MQIELLATIISSKGTMKTLRTFPFILLIVLFSAAAIPTGAEVGAVEAATNTALLPTGVRLDAVGDAIDLGSMPLAMAIAPAATNSPLFSVDGASRACRSSI